ncbi:hypothetical protein [Coleofasciculus sp. E1-EBD-02]|uniref:hypothetical protein n=1 Tax=Coleofasciculus sp. E1-EBD-02 TaxID=3068481 RepID=UPI0032F58703
MNLSPVFTKLVNNLEALPGFPNSKQILLRWTDESLELVDEISESLTLNQLYNELKAYVLPPNKLPLCLTRKPFANLDFELINILIKYTLEYPEKVGRLTDIIRALAGFKRVKPAKFIIVEAHIDLTIVDENLINALLRLGFEFDNFAKIQPEKYKYHFTLEYCINPERSHRARALFELTTERSEEAATLIQNHPHADGYVETEVYSHKDDKRYRFRPMTKEGLQHFPFNSESFRISELPLSVSDAQHKGLPLDIHRVADIHVKLPSHLNYESFKELESKEMDLLKDKLKSCGFYEIMSESANYIYTAHFYNTLESKDVFTKLVQFTENWGGFTGVSREICTKMWRKQSVEENQIILAEAPPLLSVK